MYTDLVHLEYVFRSGALDALGKEVVCYCIKPWLEPPTNHLWELLKRNPEENWNWYNFARNPNITCEMIENNPDKNWNWWELSQTSKITWEFVKNHPDKNWNWYYLSQNPIITLEIVLNNPALPWNFSAMHFNNFNA